MFATEMAPRKTTKPTPDPRAKAPWEGPAAYALLDAKAPGTLPADRQRVWLELLSSAIQAAPKLADTATALGVAHRTLVNWIATLKVDYPALYYALPPRQPTGRPWPSVTPQKG